MVVHEGGFSLGSPDHSHAFVKIKGSFLFLVYRIVCMQLHKIMNINPL